MNAGVHAAAAAIPEGLAMLGTLGIVSTMGCVHTILGDVKNQFKMDSPCACPLLLKIESFSTARERDAILGGVAMPLFELAIGSDDL